MTSQDENASSVSRPVAPGHIGLYWLAGIAVGVVNGILDLLPTVPILLIGIAGAALVAVDWLRFDARYRHNPPHGHG